MWVLHNMGPLIFFFGFFQIFCVCACVLDCISYSYKVRFNKVLFAAEVKFLYKEL